MKMKVRVNNKEMVFKKAEDGWFENKEHNLAINPEKTICRTDPWLGDAFAPAPLHEFEIITEEN